MTASTAARAVAWAVMLIGVGVFVLRRSAPSTFAPLDVLLSLLVAWIALVVLLWVGPFPNTWAVAGVIRRGVAFWLALVVLFLFCVYVFYALFFFRT